MFERVYLRPEVEDQRRRAVGIIRDLADHYLKNPGAVPHTYRQDQADTATQVIDYVSGMTDRFALREHERLLPPDSSG